MSAGEETVTDRRLGSNQYAPSTSKNGVNIVELWSEDYIHVDKFASEFVALSHFYPTSDIRIPILLQVKGCPSKSLGKGGGNEQGPI